MSRKTGVNTEEVSAKMGDLMIADQRRIDEVLRQLDRKIHYSEKRLAKESSKRHHAQEIQEKMEEKLKLAKLKVDESYQRMNEKKNAAQEQRIRIQQLNSALENSKNAKIIKSNDFASKLKDITTSFQEIRHDPVDYNPQEELKVQVGATNDAARETLSIIDELKIYNAKLSDLQQKQKIYPAELAPETAENLLKELECAQEHIKLKKEQAVQQHSDLKKERSLRDITVKNLHEELQKISNYN